MSYRNSNLSPAISVIVPTYKNTGELAKCLSLLNEQSVDFRFEIIVVVSDPNHDLKFVESQYPDIKFVRSKVRLYPGPARNYGVRNANGKYLAFIDSDCVPTLYWLQQAVNSLEEGYLIVGGPVIDMYPLHPIASSDNLMNFVDYSSGRSKGFIQYISSGNLAIKGEIFNYVAGFPDIEVTAGEDIIFNQKIISEFNQVIWFNRKMVVKHSGRRGFKSFLNHQKVFGYTRGYYGFFLKPYQRKVSQYKLAILIVMMKRLEYILRKSFMYNPVSLIRTIFYFPFLLIGLFFWALGFQAGCCDGLNNKNYSISDGSD